MNTTVRRIIILGAPAVLGILDIFHPTFSGDVLDGISAHLAWWITLHILQLPLFCLLALSVYLLLDRVRSPWALFGKITLGLFVAFYPAQDAILGIGGGVLATYGQGMVNLAQAFMDATVDSYFTSNIVMLIGTVGSFAWALTILLAVPALFRPMRPRWLIIVPLVLAALAIAFYQLVRLGWVSESLLSINNLSRIILLLAVAVGFLARPHLAAGLLVMSAYFLSVDHAWPTGPAALACYFVAALQLEFFSDKTSTIEQDTVPAEKDVVPAGEDIVPAEDVTSEERVLVEKEEPSAL